MSIKMCLARVHFVQKTQPKMRTNIWPSAISLAVFASVVFVDCSNRVADRPEANAAMASTLVSGAWTVLSPDRAHVLVFNDGMDDISKQLFFIDLGPSGSLGGVRLPAAYTSVVLSNDGKRLDCGAADGSRTAFVIDGVNTDGIVGIIGLSKIRSDDGWNLSVAKAFDSGSGWNMLGLSRVRNPGPERDPDPALCASGGPGATNCSQNYSNSGCSVSCGSGYYACCFQALNGDANCACITNK